MFPLGLGARRPLALASMLRWVRGAFVATLRKTPLAAGRPAPNSSAPLNLGYAKETSLREPRMPAPLRGYALRARAWNNGQ